MKTFVTALVLVMQVLASSQSYAVTVHAGPMQDEVAGVVANMYQQLTQSYSRVEALREAFKNSIVFENKVRITMKASAIAMPVTAGMLIAMDLSERDVRLGIMATTAAFTLNVVSALGSYVVLDMTLADQHRLKGEIRKALVAYEKAFDELEALAHTHHLTIQGEVIEREEDTVVQVPGPERVVQIEKTVEVPVEKIVKVPQIVEVEKIVQAPPQVIFHEKDCPAPEVLPPAPPIPPSEEPAAPPSDEPQPELPIHHPGA